MNPVALLKIENPHMRYLVAQFVDLVAEGVIALNGRAPSIAEFGRKQPRKSRTDGIDSLHLDPRLHLLKGLLSDVRLYAPEGQYQRQVPAPRRRDREHSRRRAPAGADAPRR